MLPAVMFGNGNQPWAVAKPREDGVFRIGLALAGTVSAAAYTAGVLDYLIEALDEWERQKAADRANKTMTVPHHDVVIDVISGTSGGGITAAIAAGALYSAFDPARYGAPDPEPARNKLYDTWVRQIDLSNLLETDDIEALAADQPLGSLLNSTALDRLADGVLDMAPPDAGDAAFADGKRRRNWVNPYLHILITSTNLLGTPYVVSFAGARQAAGYPMLNHANYMQFVVGRPVAEAPWAVALDPHDIGPGAAKRERWSRLRDAALATCAFPLGFRARWLEQRKDWYHSLNWPLPGEKGETQLAQIDPNWSNDYPSGPPSEVRFLNVDGGAINNEPYEYARSILAGAGHHNPRDVKAADRALIMIDPLFRANAGQDNVDADGKKALGRIARAANGSLLGVAGSLVGAMIAQARFKPAEISLAAAENVYSRYLIVPESAKDGVTGKRYAYPIFGELLGAFAAFASRDMREYDYFLGRRNAQRFLERHFAISEHNSLYDKTRAHPNWPAIRDAHYASDGGGPIEIEQLEEDRKTPKRGTRQRLMRIVPLCGKAVPEAKLPSRADILGRRPFGFDENTQLRARVKNRLGAIFDRLRDEFLAAPKGAGVLDRIGKWAARRYVGLGWLFGKSEVIDMIERQFAEAERQAAQEAASQSPQAGSRPYTGWHIAAPPPLSPPNDPPPRTPV